MQEEKSKVIYNVVDRIYTLKNELSEKITRGKIFDDSDKAHVLAIKLQSLASLKTLLHFCDDYSSKKYGQDPVIIKIKDNLAKNLNMNDPDKISLSLLDALSPTLDELKIYSFKNDASENSKVEEKLFTEHDVDAVNQELVRLKELLNLTDVKFTPNNVGVYMKPDPYRKIDIEQTDIMIGELTALTKISFFNVEIKSNEPKMRAISFINQLKNIFQDKKRKFELDAERKIVKQQKKENKNTSGTKSGSQPVSYVSLIHPPKETFESLLEKADNDFAVGGPTFLLRAKEKYANLKKNFGGHHQIAYVEEQIKKINGTLLQIIDGPDNTSLQKKNSDSGIKKIFPSEEKNPKKIDSEKVDSRTGKIRNDDFFRET